MKKLFPLLAAVALVTSGLAGCNQQNGMDNATMQKRIDSSYTAQRQAVVDEMNKMCADNMKANVQMKGDSIVTAGKTNM